MSLGFFVLLIALMIALICVKKWDEDSKTYQFLLVYNTAYDYKQKKADEDGQDPRPIVTQSDSDTKENLAGKEAPQEMVASTVNINHAHKSTTRTFHRPNKEEPDEKQVVSGEKTSPIGK